MQTKPSSLRSSLSMLIFRKQLTIMSGLKLIYSVFMKIDCISSILNSLPVRHFWIFTEYIIRIISKVFKTKLKCPFLSSALFCKLSGYFSICRYLYLMHKVYLYVINFVSQYLFQNIWLCSCFEWLILNSSLVTYTPTHLHSNYMSRYPKHFYT